MGKNVKLKDFYIMKYEWSYFVIYNISKNPKTIFLEFELPFGILLLMKDEGLVSVHLFKKRKLEFLGLLCTNLKYCYMGTRSQGIYIKLITYSSSALL